MIRKCFLEFNAINHRISFYKDEIGTVKMMEYILSALNNDLKLIELVRDMFGERIPTTIILNDFKRLNDFGVSEIIDILKIVVDIYFKFGNMGYISCKTLTRIYAEEYIEKSGLKGVLDIKTKALK